MKWAKRSCHRFAMAAVCILSALFFGMPSYAVYERNSVYNGVWQDWGNGWKYCYFSSGDTGWWKDGDAVRLGYQYGQGQWWDYGLGGWNAISAKNTASKFIGDGGWYDLKNGWSYSYNAATDAASWGDNNLLRLRYGYGPGQWWDYGLGGWNKIGAEKASSKFVGDGGWYDLKNGWSFYYNPGTDAAWWKDGLAVRLAYDYVRGQWWDYGLGGWNKIGAEKASSKFVGDSGWYDLNNGWSYYYNPGTDTSWWKDGSAVRLAYDYIRGQWWDYGLGGWNKIGAEKASSKFVGDGGWYDLKNGWSFYYNAATDTASWGDNNQLRLRYSYGPGQWWDYGLGGWNKIGAEKVSSKFIGDSGWYDLNNGWTYSYNPANDFAAWGDNNLLRLGYNYLSGQWSSYGIGGWSPIGGEKFSSRFIGDYGNCDLKNGWSFSYTKGSDVGFWSRDGKIRFQYYYVEGEWHDYYVNTVYSQAHVSNRLGDAGLPTAFVGDGLDHQFKEGWSYRYDFIGDQAFYSYKGNTRFKYDHIGNEWWYKDFNQDWIYLGHHIGRLWMTEGYMCDMGYNFYYGYSPEKDRGQWSPFGEDLQIKAPSYYYYFTSGQWYQWNRFSYLSVLGAPGLSGSFLGDEKWHDLKNGWNYRLVLEDGAGYWRVGDTKRFAYAYDVGRWYSTDERGAWEPLSNQIELSCDFVADGNPHDLGQVTFAYSNNTAEWTIKGASDQSTRLKYDYISDTWVGKYQGSSEWMVLPFQDNCFWESPALLTNYLQNNETAWRYNEPSQNMVNNPDYQWVLGIVNGTWSNQTTGRYRFFYNNDTQKVAQHLLSNSSLAFMLAKNTILGAQYRASSPIDVYIVLESGGSVYGVTFRGADLERLGDYQYDRKAGLIVLNVKSDPSELEKTFYEAVLAHETTHLLLNYALTSLYDDMGTYRSWLTEGISRPDNDDNHFTWFTESLAWYLGSIAYVEKKPDLDKSEYVPENMAWTVDDLAKKLNIEDVEENLKKLGWSKAGYDYKRSEFTSNHVYLFLGTGLFLTKSVNGELTRSAINYVLSRSVRHKTLEDGLAGFYGKHTGDDDPSKKRTLWQDFVAFAEGLDDWW